MIVVQTIEHLPITGKRVLLRAGLNVPLDSEGRVADDFRLKQALPTIRHAAERKAKVIVAGHVGRPTSSADRVFSLVSVAHRLEQLLGQSIAMAGDCVGRSVHDQIAQLQPGKILLLENLRFHPQESNNDEEFARQLASLADVYINDAFSVSHREHASIVGVASHCPTTGVGFLMEKELEALSRLRNNPASPFVVIVGGAKVRTKLHAVRHFVRTCDDLVLGGLMGLTMLHANGIGVGRSHIDQDLVKEAKTILAESRHARAKMFVAKDHLVAEDFAQSASVRPTKDASIPEDCVGCDIGPRTIDDFIRIVRNARTVFWNGPMGASEIFACTHGTKAVAEAITEEASYNVAGGGDTVAYLVRSGFAKSFSHLSTGGGAALQYLVAGSLPGLEALQDRQQT
ncbi:MAG: phosphoglycerate kinase [Nitrospira sp. WS110]|nr:phosphoglycerate kinase [Nitrospira sp. WS110]